MINRLACAQAGLEVDELTNSLLLESCRVAEDVTRGREIYRRMRHSGMTPPARCCRWLVQGAVRSQSL